MAKGGSPQQELDEVPLSRPCPVITVIMVMILMHLLLSTNIFKTMISYIDNSYVFLFVYSLHLLACVMNYLITKEKA